MKNKIEYYKRMDDKGYIQEKCDYILSTGKYKGKLLNSIDDREYLIQLMKSSSNGKDKSMIKRFIDFGYTFRLIKNN